MYIRMIFFFNSTCINDVIPGYKIARNVFHDVVIQYDLAIELYLLISRHPYLEGNIQLSNYIK